MEKILMYKGGIVVLAVAVVMIIVLKLMVKLKYKSYIKLFAPWIIKLIDKWTMEDNGKLKKAIVFVEDLILSYCPVIIKGMVDKLINAEYIASLIEMYINRLRNKAIVEFDIKGAKIIKEKYPALAPQIDEIIKEVVNVGLDEGLKLLKK